MLAGLPGNLGSVPIKKIVTHLSPDVDAIVCICMARKHLSGAADAEIVYVPSGGSLVGSESDLSVLHVDTGGGQFDHHGRRLDHTSSVALLAEALGLTNDPGWRLILEMVADVDNARTLLPTSVGRLLKGFPGYFRTPNGIDWPTVLARSIEVIDVLYGQEVRRVKAKADLGQNVAWKRLENGVVVGFLFGRPDLAATAFEEGVPDVVVWTQRFGTGQRCYVGVFTNERSTVTVGVVAQRLRQEEFRKRGKRPWSDLNHLGQRAYEGIEDWFLDDKMRFVLRGSRTHPLPVEQRTVLTEVEIERIVCNALGEIRRNGN